MCGERSKFLARVRLNVNLKKGVVEFELPDFGGTRGGANGIVSDEVLEQYADVLLKESENWGIIELALGSTLEVEDEDNDRFSGSAAFFSKLLGKTDSVDKEEKKKSSIKPKEIYLSAYKPFCPYRVDLDFYKEARKQFDIHEWIDVIISAVDYKNGCKSIAFPGISTGAYGYPIG